MEGYKYNRGVATIAMPLGTLCPDELQIVFTPEEPAEPEAERLVGLYVKHAVPWYKEHQSYEAILPYLFDGVESLGGYPERVASAYYLMGRTQEARQFTLDFLTKEEEYFAPFAKPFLKLLDEESA